MFRILEPLAKLYAIAIEMSIKPLHHIWRYTVYLLRTSIARKMPKKS